MVTATNNLNVFVREFSGTGNSRKIRKEGLVPGIVYGKKKPCVLIAIDEKKLAKELAQPGFYTKLFKLVGKDIDEQVLIKSIDFNYLKDKTRHVDFIRVAKNQKIQARVTLEYLGKDDAIGIKRGGTFNAIKQNILIRCPVGKVPKNIKIDITPCDINDSIHIRDIDLPEGLVHLEPEDRTVATISSG